MPDQRQEPAFQLFRLPREKHILDYVLARLCEGASPEKHELAETLLNMYRTSAGFDPSALSKGRFRRLKAADFRSYLSTIDQEIGELLESKPYQDLIRQKNAEDPLFAEYLQLSTAIAEHPALSLVSETEHFEESTTGQDTPELLLLLYRKQPGFLDELYRKEGYEVFLRRYDQQLARMHHLQLQFRLSFELLQLELDASRGISVETRAQEILEALGKLLSTEKSASLQREILRAIVRSALLCSTPSQQLAVYLDHLENSLDELFRYMDAARMKMLTLLAHYHMKAGRDKRLAWLEEAEAEARRTEQHDERPGFRFIRCVVETDAGNTDAALRHLNEAEHLIYKTSNRSLAARNNWVKLCEFRTLLYAVATLEGDKSHLSQFSTLRQLAEDMGHHRKEMGVLLQEWKGIEYILSGDDEDARSHFEKARTYRTHQPDHPWSIIDDFFVASLGKSKKKAGVPALRMQELEEPFYSKVCTQLFRLFSQSRDKIAPSKQTEA